MFTTIKIPGGRELQINDPVTVVNQTSGEKFEGTLTDIVWTVYLANKKASWYEFDQTNGEHGYSPNHPLRNPTITEVDARQKLIIDPVRSRLRCRPRAERRRRRNSRWAAIRINHSLRRLRRLRSLRSEKSKPPGRATTRGSSFSAAKATQAPVPRDWVSRISPPSPITTAGSTIFRTAVTAALIVSATSVNGVKQPASPVSLP